MERGAFRQMRVEPEGSVYVKRIGDVLACENGAAAAPDKTKLGEPPPTWRPSSPAGAGRGGLKPAFPKWHRHFPSKRSFLMGPFGEKLSSIRSVAGL